MAWLRDKSANRITATTSVHNACNSRPLCETQHTVDWTQSWTPIKDNLENVVMRGWTCVLLSRGVYYTWNRFAGFRWTECDSGMKRFFCRRNCRSVVIKCGFDSGIFLSKKNILKYSAWSSTIKCIFFGWFLFIVSMNNCLFYNSDILQINKIDIFERLSVTSI